LVYGAIFAWIGTTALAASLAEMASITPVVGAQYRWTALYAPPRLMSPAFWGLLQGWITVFGWIATVATPAFLIGTQIEGLLILNDSTYLPEGWHGTLFAWAVLAIPVLCNIFARKLLAPIEYIGGFTHMGFLIVYVVVLCVMASKSTATYVFTTTTSGLSGWTNSAVSWNIGLLTAVFPIGGMFVVLFHLKLTLMVYRL
jgi:choline transport protein